MIMMEIILDGGEIYKDSSGSYRKFGDDFVDGEGNWVRL